MSDRGLLAVGTHLADYHIQGVLGAGGFGVTYKALDTTANQLVAIKEYYPSELATRDPSNRLLPISAASDADYRLGLTRFIDEARTLALFRHRNIVRVLRLLQLNNTAYLVLSLEQGVSFRDWLRRLRRKPTQAELDAFVDPLLEALEVIHTNGMLHRDISPDNIVMRDNGSPVLLDFGSARQVLGNRGFMSAIVKHGFSPQEQYASDPSKQGPWSDIYAFAATIYYAVTGHPPPQSMSRIDRDTIVRLATISGHGWRPGFLAAVDAGLTLHPRARPQMISAWRQQLWAGRGIAPTRAVAPAPAQHVVAIGAKPAPGDYLGPPALQPMPGHEAAGRLGVAIPVEASGPAQLPSEPPSLRASPSRRARRKHVLAKISGLLILLVALASLVGGFLLVMQ